MAVKSLRTIQEITYDWGKVNNGVVFDKVVTIGRHGDATVVVVGVATLVLPKDTYEILDGER